MIQGIVGVSSRTQLLKEARKVVLVPVRGDLQYVQYMHPPSSMNRNRTVVKMDQWLVDKSTKLWQRMSQSPRWYNVQLVRLAKRLMDSVPWQEDSFRSVPIETHLKKLEGSISIYSPHSEDTMAYLKKLCRRHADKHYKRLWLCLIGLPLTIPVAIVPFVPNVPGFYLLYRSYCNYKAYHGAMHLQRIISSGNYNLFKLTDFPKLSPISDQYPTAVADYFQEPALETYLRKAIVQTSKSK